MFNCDVCTIVFATFEEFKKHYDEIHKVENGSKYICPTRGCERLYQTNNSFKKHCIREHQKLDF